LNARLAPGIRAFLAAEIQAAGGREVSFFADLDQDGVVTGARVGARGTVDMVLALSAGARRGQMLLHNHPSGILEPSAADLNVAAQLHDAGVGFGILNNAATELYVVVEVPRDRPVVPIDPYEVVATLGERGPIALQ
jgi:ATP-dependent DNA helicase DinG